MRRAKWARTAAVAAVLGLLWFFAPASLGGQTSYISTYGDSMEPRFQTGDLAVVRPAASYQVGDVVAYKSELLQTHVMHRIVDVQDGRFTLQGDNNSWIDPEQPRRDQLIGTLAFGIPHGGFLLDHLSSPLMLALIIFALLVSGGGIMTRRRRKRRKPTMPRHTIAAGNGPVAAFRTLPPSLRAVTVGTLVLAGLGTTLAAVAWTGPLVHSSAAESASGAQMDFSYTADVGQSAAYDGTVANSPDPVFRKLTDAVDVHFAYQGEPGTITVTAELSTPSGWRSTLTLEDAETFTGNGYEGTVQLDLQELDAKAQAASEVTGLAAEPVSIAVTAHVQTTTGSDFRPALNLQLSPLQLALVGEPENLTVTDGTVAEEPRMIPRTVGPDSWSLTAVTARIISAGMLLMAMIISATLIVLARKTAPMDEGAAIRRRYAALLVRVHPMSAPQGRPVIDVTTFATLAKLAERYGLLVLHWTRSHVETFVVQDENITYRYRTGEYISTDDASMLPVSLDA